MFTRQIEILKRAKEILSGSRTLAFDGMTPVYAPDAKKFYKGMYWRDFCYTTEGFSNLLPLIDIENAIHYLLNPPLLKGRILHKCRTKEGELKYNRQYPDQTPFSADNPMFAVKVVDEYIKRGGNIDIFKEHSEKLEIAMNNVILSKDYLVEDPVGPFIYGFYDTICMTGKECFASLLFIDAAIRLSAMYQRLGDVSHSNQWQKIADKTCAALSRLWIAEEGLFMSDTGTNRQIDIWGSAYAVYSGAIDEGRALSISEWFIRNFERCIRWGHVRQLPTPEYWPGAFKNVYPDIHPLGHYQNGGYWSVPTPWVIYTIGLKNKDLAKEIQKALESALLKFDFPECINEDGSCKLPEYTASAAMGMLALKILR